MRIKLVLILASLFHVGSIVLMFYRVEPFQTFNDPIAAWAMVFIVASLNRIVHGNSIIFRDRWSLFQTAVLSVAVYYKDPRYHTKE